MSQELIHRRLLEEGITGSSPEARSWVRTHLQLEESSLDEYFGDGPLQTLLADPEITEILVNGAQEIWTERAGKLTKTALNFSGDDSLRRYVRRMLAAQGKKIDHLQPFSDATIHNRFRVHVAMSPIAELSTLLSIRKFPEKSWSLRELAAKGMFTAMQLQFLQTAIRERKNIFVSGQTGAGKTTLLSALISEVDPNERIIALEDISELKSEHPHFLKMQTRLANSEGEGEINLRRILKESLRMRPDRLVIGECRGEEALDLILALSSGHLGSMGTIHAGSPREALQRLEMLAVLGRSNISEFAVKALIASAVHIILQVQRCSDSRKLVSICEVKGQDSGAFLLREQKM